MSRHANYVHENARLLSARDIPAWVVGRPLKDVYDELISYMDGYNLDPGAHRDDQRRFGERWCSMASAFLRRAKEEEGGEAYRSVLVVTPDHPFFPYADQDLRPGALVIPGIAGDTANPTQTPGTSSAFSGFSHSRPDTGSSSARRGLESFGPGQFDLGDYDLDEEYEDMVNQETRDDNEDEEMRIETEDEDMEGEEMNDEEMEDEEDLLSRKRNPSPDAEHPPSKRSKNDAQNNIVAGEAQPVPDSRPPTFLGQLSPEHAALWNLKTTRKTKTSWPEMSSYMRHSLGITETRDWKKEWDGLLSRKMHWDAPPGLISALSAGDGTPLMVWELKSRPGNKEPSLKSVRSDLKERMGVEISLSRIKSTWSEILDKQKSLAAASNSPKPLYGFFDLTENDRQVRLLLPESDQEMCRLRETGGHLNSMLEWPTVLQKLKEGKHKDAFSKMSSNELGPHYVKQLASVAKAKPVTNVKPVAKVPITRAKPVTKPVARVPITKVRQRRRLALDPGLKTIFSELEAQVFVKWHQDKITLDVIQQQMNAYTSREGVQSEEFYKEQLVNANRKFNEWSVQHCLDDIKAIERLASLSGQPQTSSPHDYEILPEAVLLDMAGKRGVRVTYSEGNRATHRDITLALMRADALEGKAPLKPHYMDIYSSPPTSHDPEDLRRMAEHNRTLLTALLVDSEAHLDKMEKILPARPDWNGKWQQIFRDHSLWRSRRHPFLHGDHRRMPAPLRVCEQMLLFMRAREGISPPTYISYGTSIYHEMSWRQLIARARACQMPVPSHILTSENADEEDPDAGLDSISRKQNLVRWLIDNSPSFVTYTNDAGDEFARSLSGRMHAPLRLYTTLEQKFVRRMFAPDAIYFNSNDAWEAALHAARRVYERSPERISIHEALAMQFNNGSPTIAFQTFLRVHLQQERGLSPETQDFDSQLRKLSSPDMVPLTMTLQFLQHEGVIDANYVLAVVNERITSRDPNTGEILQQPATIQLLSRTTSDDTRFVWLYNDHSGAWSPIVQYGSRPQLIDSWGMLRPGVEYLPTQTTLRRPTATKPAEEMSRSIRSLNNERNQRQLQKCYSCQDRHLACDLAGTPASKVEGKVCTPCDDLGIDCEFDETLERTSFHRGCEVTPEMIQSWELDRPPTQEEAANIRKHTDLFLPVALANPAQKYGVHIHSMRVSSQRPPAYTAMLINRLPVFQLRVDALTTNAAGRAEQEFVRPGGAGTPLQFFGMVTQRRGVLPWPTTLTNHLADPFLRGLVHLSDSWLDPNIRSPDALLITTSGVAGATVNIAGFGDHNRGFFHKLTRVDVAKGTQLANNTDLMTLIEEHAHHGHGHSIPAAARQYFVHHVHKYMIRNPLVDLIDRWSELQLPNPPQFFRNNQANARLDAQLYLLADEYAWRSHWLNAATVPTDVQILARNVSRNAPWR